MSENREPAPGWYDDPAGGESVRWWDGGAWSDEVRAVPRPAAGRSRTPGAGWQWLMAAGFGAVAAWAGWLLWSVR